MMHFRKPGWMLSGMLCVACLPAAVGAKNHIADSKAGIDPATGTRRALSEAESVALERPASMAARTTMPQIGAPAQASVRHLPNGAVVLKVTAAQLSSLTATRQADGSMRIEHGDHFDTQPAHAGQGALPHE